MIIYLMTTNAALASFPAFFLSDVYFVTLNLLCMWCFYACREIQTGAVFTDFVAHFQSVFLKCSARPRFMTTGCA